jgi:hypothetical protein
MRRSAVSNGASSTDAIRDRGSCLGVEEQLECG